MDRNDPKKTSQQGQRNPTGGQGMKDNTGGKGQNPKKPGSTTGKDPGSMHNRDKDRNR